MKKILLLIIGLALAGCGSDSSDEPGQVRIVRDNYGTPHIYADDVYGLYFGYGYAVAQDRLFQMEMTRRSTQGMVAEVLGRDYLEYDIGTRRRFSPASIRRQLDGLGAGRMEVLQGFADGMNRWLDDIRADPEALMPKQFMDNDFQPLNWTAYDVAMIFIGTMANRYGDFNTELDNASILESLASQHGAATAARIFDILNPRFTDNAPTTIPLEDWSVPAPDRLQSASQEIAALRDYRAFEGPVSSGMSNCYVLGKSRVTGANSILVNGPQFGWFNPAYVYSVGLHGAGIDVVGNTPFAYPMIMFGHNNTITWGSTWGAGDIVDIYAEQLNPDNPRQYLHMGEYRELQHRTEEIQVLGEDVAEVDAYRSVHGPIVHQDPASGIAYAKHRAWDGLEIDTLFAWLDATRAADFESWKAAAQVSAINVNMYYADVFGNIGYFFGGHYPDRVQGHDNRFPASGDGSMEWQSRMPIEVSNPHVQNPGSGFLANWNNKPGQGVMNPDFFFYSWSEADRVDYLNQALQRHDSFTPDEAWALLRGSSYTDIHAPYLLPMIDDAIKDSDNDRLKAANGILQRWDLQSADSDNDGDYDGAATAIFRTFVGQLIEDVLRDDLGEVFAPFSATGYAEKDAPTGAGTNIQSGMKAVIESLSGRGSFDLLNGQSPASVITGSLSTALATLSAEQGSDITAFRRPVAQRPFSNINFLGIPQAAASEVLVAPIEQNRGTENNMIVMNEGAIVGWEIAPPGQSGFMSPAGEKSPHYDDQLEMYQNFDKKRMWFYNADVEANKTTQEIIRYERHRGQPD